MTTDRTIVHVAEPVGPATEQFVEVRESDPAIGKWYWVSHAKTDEKWFGCVTHVGSNYCELRGIGEHAYVRRVHANEFEKVCEYVPNPDAVIDGEVERFRKQTFELMDKVREITARLSISNNPALNAHSETSALALRPNNEPVDEYKKALILAKEETLPNLFEAIKRSNEQLGKWMKAKLLPLKAQAATLDTTIEAIENRIFNVELYAGLVEEVVQIKDGTPAPLTEKIRLFQRRAYMDEECIAQYEAGGMEFKNIGEFDRWIRKISNRDRLLPFPRCILAFQVRRHKKGRPIFTLSDFFAMVDLEKLDKLTFLYVRNGDQLFRLSTAIEFGATLFPDLDEQKLNRGVLWAQVDSSRSEPISKLTTDDEYQAKLKEREEYEQKLKRTPEKDRWRVERPELYFDNKYEKYTPESVYYDDISKYIAKQIARHNRLVLVLQGLLDRSPIFQPHPQWQLWTSGGFSQALELIYDDSRSLTTGDKPDFEVYRKRLNASLKPGSVTIGQERAWLRVEAAKEAERRRRAGEGRFNDFEYEWFRPTGDPGPGKLAFVTKIKKGRCFYTWQRSRRNSWRDDTKILASIDVNTNELFNVSAYKPGDFKQFFADPRTRADYLQWAPLLLEAEEYHAGNREVAETKPLPSRPKRTYIKGGSPEYRERKRLKALIGQAVRLVRKITTRGGSVYEKGSLWRVSSGRGDSFSIYGINKDGSREKVENSRGINNVPSYDFEVDPSIPAEKDE